VLRGARGTLVGGRRAANGDGTFRIHGLLPRFDVCFTKRHALKGRKLSRREVERVILVSGFWFSKATFVMLRKVWLPAGMLREGNSPTLIYT
jgi:hypothetical protein